MDQPYIPRQSFLASNSCEGFQSYLSSALAASPVDRLFIVKGGPGTGKSHFMRVVARRARERGYTVTEYLCSSDPASLDGLRLSREGAPTLGFWDGTPPHALDPVLPGAMDEIVNLGMFWDAAALGAQREAIEALGKRKATAYANAYAALSAAGRMDGIAETLAEPGVARERLVALAARLLRDQPEEGESRPIPALRRAVSMGGKHTLHSFEATATRLLLPDEGFGLGYRLTEAMLEISRSRGLRVVVSYHPVYPHKIDGLFYPSTGLCALVGEASPPEGIPVRSLSLRRYTNTETLRSVRGELRRTVSLREELTDAALRHLATASACHFELERIYAEAMDFTAKEAYTERFCERILEG